MPSALERFVICSSSTLQGWILRSTAVLRDEEGWRATHPLRPIALFQPLLCESAANRSSSSYVVLTVTQTLYAYFVEGDIVYVSNFDKRVSARLGRDAPPSKLHTLHY